MARVHRFCLQSSDTVLFASVMSVIIITNIALLLLDIRFITTLRMVINVDIQHSSVLLKIEVLVIL